MYEISYRFSIKYRQFEKGKKKIKGSNEKCGSSLLPLSQNLLVSLTEQKKLEEIITNDFSLQNMVIDKLFYS